MVRNYQKKTNRGQLPLDVLKHGVEEVLGGASLRETAKTYNMSAETLRRAVRKTQDGQELKTFTESCVTRKVFTAEEELEIRDYILKTTRIGFPLDTKTVRRLAFQLAEKKQKSCPSTWKEQGLTGIEWMRRFVKRHKSIDRLIPKTFGTGRATGFKKANVDAFFNKLQVLYTAHSFAPEHVYNLGEVGVTVPHTAQNVIAVTGAVPVPQIASHERDQTVTLCGFINAGGNSIPPCLIFPKAEIQFHMMFNAYPGTCGLASPGGRMTGKIFLYCLQHFVQHSQSSKENPTLLLLDIHESHVTLDAVDFCRQNGIHLLGFPPLFTHRIQPLDRAVFGPFKKHYSIACSEWMVSNPGGEMTMDNVADVTGRAYPKAFTPFTITNGFRSTGISPLNANIFSEKDFLQSSLTEHREHDGQPVMQVVRISTLQAVRPEDATTATVTSTVQSDDATAMTVASTRQSEDASSSTATVVKSEYDTSAWVYQPDSIMQNGPPQQNEPGGTTVAFQNCSPHELSQHPKACQSTDRVVPGTSSAGSMDQGSTSHACQPGSAAFMPSCSSQVPMETLHRETLHSELPAPVASGIHESGSEKKLRLKKRPATEVRGARPCQIASRHDATAVSCQRDTHQDWMMEDQTETGGKRPRIEGSRVQELGSPPVHSSAYLRWKRLGAQLGLYGDSDIACFLLKYYMQTSRILPAGFTGECQTCGAPLSFSCTACDRTLSTHATHTSPLPKTSVKDAAQEEGEGRSDDDRGDNATCRPLLPKLETDVATEEGGEGNSDDDDEGDEGGSLSQYPQVSFNVGKEGGGVGDPALNLEMKPEPPWSVKEEPQDQPSAVYSTVQPLSDNTESLPSLNTSHVCQHCFASFALLSSLELHMATFHGETLHDLFLTYSAYKCYGVGYQRGSKIVNEGSYEKEKAVEGRKEKVEDSDSNWTDKRKKSRKHACNMCNKAFTSPSSLKKHSVIHTGHRSFVCDVCNKAFTQSSSLKIHQKIHTGHKSFVCDICNKAFTQSGNLKTHMRIHTGDKSYVCEVCNKAFRHSTTLKEHQLKHSDHKLYECDVCGKAFCYTVSLRRHKLQHSNFKPFECDVCGKAFAGAAQLKRHREIHTGPDTALPKVVFSSREAADLFPSPDTADGTASGMQALYLGIDTLSQVWKAADI